MDNLEYITKLHLLMDKATEMPQSLLQHVSSGIPKFLILNGSKLLFLLQLLPSVSPLGKSSPGILKGARDLGNGQCHKYWHYL